MNNRITYTMYQAFQRLGFSVMRFNFRGVGRSQGRYDGGIGEIGDAAAALDWMQAVNPNSGGLWIAGYSFGAFIGMQLLMRRPEISGWVSVAPPANHYDFGFLAPVSLRRADAAWRHRRAGARARGEEAGRQAQYPEGRAAWTTASSPAATMSSPAMPTSSPNTSKTTCSKTMARRSMALAAD